jgi:hypothetical protein
VYKLLPALLSHQLHAVHHQSSRQRWKLWSLSAGLLCFAFKCPH